MSDLRALIQNLSVGRHGSSAAPNSLRMTPDGALYTAPYPLSAAVEGNVFGMNAGTVTTPLSTAATTALANTTPHAWVRVPDGTVIIPLYASITVETSGITTQGEASIVIAQNDIGNGTSSAGTGPVSFNTAAPVTSACTVRALATGATTAPTNPLELARFSFAASTVNTNFTWTGGEHGYWPIVRGAGSWAIYLGGNAVGYFAQMIWVELSESGLS